MGDRRHAQIVPFLQGWWGVATKCPVETETTNMAVTGCAERTRMDCEVCAQKHISLDVMTCRVKQGIVCSAVDGSGDDGIVVCAAWYFYVERML